MSKRFALIAAAAALALAAGATTPLSAEMAEKTVNVGGAPMYPSKNIIQNAVNSKDHTTLVAAVTAPLKPARDGAVSRADDAQDARSFSTSRPSAG